MLRSGKTDRSNRPTLLTVVDLRRAPARLTEATDRNN